MVQAYVLYLATSHKPLATSYVVTQRFLILFNTRLEI